MNLLRYGLALPLVLLLAACARLKQLPPRSVESTLPLGDQTKLDKLAAGLAARHSGQSGFRLLADGPEAFVTRVQSARLAARGLDVQPYIWHGDTTGVYPGQE